MLLRSGIGSLECDDLDPRPFLPFSLASLFIADAWVLPSGLVVQQAALRCRFLPRCDLHQ